VLDLIIKFDECLEKAERMTDDSQVTAGQTMSDDSYTTIKMNSK